MMKKILIVDDEKNIRDLLNIYLQKAGFDTVQAKNGQEALDLFEKEKPHLILLDLMLPYVNGIAVAKKIRRHSNVPILMLTAKAEEDDRISGLDLGADDYVVKPFSPREVVARVKSLLRRSYSDEQIIKIKDLEIHPKKMKVIKKGTEITLTTKEFKILTMLAEKPGVVFSREQIMNKTYTEYDEVVFDRTIDAYIKNIRKKLNDNPKHPEYIESVYGAGYKFKGEK
ncbi:MAG: response regulator transcription factor [Caldisericaceae bacterium]|nr:response regulator transcription factor [Caldisericaceae bacterium]